MSFETNFVFWLNVRHFIKKACNYYWRNAPYPDRTIIFSIFHLSLIMHISVRLLKINLYKHIQHFTPLLWIFFVFFMYYMYLSLSYVPTTSRDGRIYLCPCLASVAQSVCHAYVTLKVIEPYNKIMNYLSA